MLFIFSYDSTIYLEWEIVCTTAGSRSSWLSWREWSCGTSCRSSRSSLRRSTHWREWSSTRLNTTHHANCIRIYLHYIPSTYIVKPTTIIFVSINVE